METEGGEKAAFDYWACCTRFWPVALAGHWSDQFHICTQINKEKRPTHHALLLNCWSMAPMSHSPRQSSGACLLEIQNKTKFVKNKTNNCPGEFLCTAMSVCLLTGHLLLLDVWNLFRPFLLVLTLRQHIIMQIKYLEGIYVKLLSITKIYLWFTFSLLIHARQFLARGFIKNIYDSHELNKIYLWFTQKEKLKRKSILIKIWIITFFNISGHIYYQAGVQAPNQSCQSTWS
jgi:hypothetical protein